MADSASNSAINIPETINLCSEIEDSNSNVDDSEMIDTTVDTVGIRKTAIYSQDGEATALKALVDLKDGNVEFDVLKSGGGSTAFQHPLDVCKGFMCLKTYY